MTPAYGGFPKGFPRFLAQLGANNRNEWFAAHRPDYEAFYVEPAMAFVEAMAPLLKKLSPDIHAVPKFGGSVGRVNRDIRFAKDKRPYKDHIDLWFWQGKDKGSSPGLWFSLGPKVLVIGVGSYRFQGLALERYRAAVAEDKRGAAVAKALAALERKGYDVGGSHYKRVPAPYPADHPRATLLRHDGLYVGTHMRLPKELSAPRFTAFVAAHYRALMPVQRWLVDVL